jgi:hypothetical protein
MRTRILLVTTCVVSIAACGNSRERTADDEVGHDSGIQDAEQGTAFADDSSSEGSEATSAASEDADADSSSDTSADPKFDTLAVPDALLPNCGGMGMADPEFSYIWVANSLEGTISKIDTVTLLEEGRYKTRADSVGSPSRTSVNLSGDVAVANRSGGITKVIARHEACDEKLNGQAGLQTSSGKFDVLPWGEDDCVAWHTPMPGYNTNRPAAWTAGVLNPITCEIEDQYFWTSAANTEQLGSLHVMRLDGVDGSIDEDLAMPDITVGSFGAYGGAVNSENDFWFITYSQPRVLVRVDFDSLVHDVWEVPPSVCSYGFTVDSLDRPWIGGFCDGSAFFDPKTEEFTLLAGMLGYGLQEDDQGVMWLATYSPPGLRGIDISTLQQTKWILLPPNASARGVSVDFFGYVWFVSMENSAYRVDTLTETWESYDGLDAPYTYSDMTGHGLHVVSGGLPQG